MESVIDSVEADVTELCRALPFIDEDDMLGLSELKLEREGAAKRLGAELCRASGM